MKDAGPVQGQQQAQGTRDGGQQVECECAHVAEEEARIEDLEDAAAGLEGRQQDQ